MNKILSKEVKIGIAVIVSALILIFGIDYLKGINLMKPSNYFSIEFDKVNGLTLSAPVEVEGYRIGLVREMNYDYANGKVYVEVDLDKSVKLPRGSYAELEVDLLGTAIVALHIDRSSNEYYSTGDTISGITSADIMDKVNSDILPQLTAMLPKIDSILSGVNGIVNSHELESSLKRVDRITANLETATGNLSSFTSGRLESIGGNIDTATVNIKNFTAQLDHIKIKEMALTADTAITNIKDITAKINSNTNTIGLLLNERGMYDDLMHTVSSADSLLIDLRKNPGRYVHFSVFGGRKK